MQWLGCWMEWAGVIMLLLQDKQEFTLSLRITFSAVNQKDLDF